MTFCDICSDFDLGKYVKIAKEVSPSHQKWTTFKSLERRAEEGCPLCHLFISTLSTTQLADLRASSIPATVLIEPNGAAQDFDSISTQRRKKAFLTSLVLI